IKIPLELLTLWSHDQKGLIISGGTVILFHEPNFAVIVFTSVLLLFGGWSETNSNVQAVDNRIIQEQLNQKTLECEDLQGTISSLRQQLSSAVEQRSFCQIRRLHIERQIGKESSSQKDQNTTMLRQEQANDVEELIKKLGEVIKSKEELVARNKKLADESSYAKGLASAAAVELKALSEEVAKLMNHNERLSAELEVQKKPPAQLRSSIPTRNGGKYYSSKKQETGVLASEMKKELAVSREREHLYEAILAEKQQIEGELQRKVEESKQREAYLENELANMWILVAKRKKQSPKELKMMN
ncbi:P-loop containing nucleoside triphosphatehydrolases superfamily protein, partial [Striga asiatica]